MRVSLSKDKEMHFILNYMYVHNLKRTTSTLKSVNAMIKIGLFRNDIIW